MIIVPILIYSRKVKLVILKRATSQLKRFLDLVHTKYTRIHVTYIFQTLVPYSLELFEFAPLSLVQQLHILIALLWG